MTQIIPSAVWKQVYFDFKEIYPQATFTEKALKERVCEALTELDTDTSNGKRSNLATLQSDEVLKKIRLTDGLASRNVLLHRASLIAGNKTFLLLPPPLAKVEASSHSRAAAVSKPRTKAIMLQDQVDTIANISTTLAMSSSKRDQVIDVKPRSVHASSSSCLMSESSRRRR